MNDDSVDAVATLWALVASSPSRLKLQDLLIRICISGLVVEYIVAIDVTRVRFPADAYYVNAVGD